MNNSKKRCLKNSNLSSQDSDETDKNIRSEFDSIINVIYDDISNDSFILSNFDKFMNRLSIQIKRYIKIFEKEFNGKQD